MGSPYFLNAVTTPSAEDMAGESNQDVSKQQDGRED